MTEKHKGMLEELLETEGGLTAWEMDFLESMEKLAEGERELTELQGETLEKIWNKVYGG